MDNRQVALAFVEAINRHDTDSIMALTSENHVFVDTHGNRESREDMATGWPGYFAWFPDYKIEVEELFEKDGMVALMGYASGTFSQKKQGGYWRLPAAWKVGIEGGRVALWQVYCDSKIPYEILDNPD